MNRLLSRLLPNPRAAASLGGLAFVRAVVLAAAVSAVVGCSPQDGAAMVGSGAGGALAPGTGGGSERSGGAPGSGGAATGGRASTGGATPSGGASPSGGAVGAAGATATGGAASGGAPATGGAAGTGGSAGAGGRAGTGGARSGGAPGTGGAGGTASAGPCPPGITQVITVAKDGSGQFTTVQAALSSLASNSTARVRVDIKAGTYREKLTISHANLCLVGASATTTILTYNDANATVGSTSGSASVLVSANDFSAANLTFENSYGAGSQAVALRTTGQRQQYLNCRFVGHQDTLYTHQGSQYFKNCYVQGNTDYVFGGATAVLDGCEVRNVEGGSAVAAPNTDLGASYGIVFLGGKFTAASGVQANSVGLGRPWGADGAAAYLRVELGAHIIAAGFVPMSGNQPQNARFREYQSTGAGANTASRASYQLTAAQAGGYTLATILGGWTPTFSQ